MYYAWRHEGVEGVLKANSKLQAAALAAKRLGAIGHRDHPKVEELGENLYRVVSCDGRKVTLEVFYLGNRRPRNPDGYVLQRVTERETRVLPDEAALAVIHRYLAHGGTPDGAVALWRLHERYRAMYARR